MITKITVTKQHIKQGSRSNPLTCPVSMALREAFPGEFISVGVTSFSMRCPNRYKLPRRATKFILDFDRQRPVQPFSFSVRTRK